jgi:hypothetical protein
VLTNYKANSDLSALQTQLTDFSNAVTALTPADATENEQVFMQALSKIETNITNCIISDAIAVGAQLIAEMCYRTMTDDAFRAEVHESYQKALKIKLEG